MLITIININDNEDNTVISLLDVLFTLRPIVDLGTIVLAVIIWVKQCMTDNTDDIDNI